MTRPRSEEKITEKTTDLPLLENSCGFEIRRGTSLSHLFVDPDPPTCGRDAYFTVRDARYIRELGLDHIRIAVSEQLLWSESGTIDADLSSLLGDVVTLAIDEGLRVIVCLFLLRSHPYPPLAEQRRIVQAKLGRTDYMPTDATLVPLFREEVKVRAFCQRWRDLSNRLCHHPNDRLAYELYNEPLAPCHDYWNRVIASAHAEVRALEPNRMLVIGCNLFSVPPAMKRLILPAGDGNLLPSFHFYYPNLLTNYRADWMDFGAYQGSVGYPGRPVRREALEKLPFELRRTVEERNQPVSKQFFRKEITDAAAAGRRLGYLVHCGEFGCMDTVPADVRARWYGDVVDVLDECGIPWTQWDWKGNFGILDKTSWRLSGIEGALRLRSPRRARPPSPKPPILRRVMRRLGRLRR